MTMVRITWTAGPLSASVRIPRFELGAYVQQLVDRHGRNLSIRIEAA